MTADLRTRDSDGFREAVLYVMDLHERGLVVSFSAHLDPTGIGRISFITHPSASIDLADLPGVTGDDTDKE